jgi:hypothetical protein
LNVYTQVVDDAKRAAAQKIGSELFTIVHSREGAAEGVNHTEEPA